MLNALKKFSKHLKETSIHVYDKKVRIKSALIRLRYTNNNNTNV